MKCKVSVLEHAGRAMDIRFFEHLIIGDGCHFSFADEGLIEEYQQRAVLGG